jgi:hypothetical protein
MPKIDGRYMYLLVPKKCEYIHEKNQASGANIKHETWIKCDIGFDTITRECIVGKISLNFFITGPKMINTWIIFLAQYFQGKKIDKVV